MSNIGPKFQLTLPKRSARKFSPRARAKLLWALLRGAGVVLVFALIWGPWFSYNQVPEVRLAPDTIERARRIPGDALLAELGGYNLHQALLWADDRQLVTAAEKLLVGRIELPGFQADTIAPPLNATTMASGPTKWQLFVHSLGLPRVLLDAYKVSDRTEFLDAAAEYLLAYDTYEGSGWAPGGYLWKDEWRGFVRNDHAVAARVSVLTEFWRLYRRSPSYRPDVAEAVFRMAGRAAYLLADPSRFTVATNHGIMQNLAACNVGLSFPTLPGAEGRCRLAFKRLDEQLAFLIDDEGFVHEHSPGYQGYAVVLMGIALRYLTLSEQEISQRWLQKYQAAQRVYAELRRPDGSLPVFGDTDGSGGVGPVVFAELRRPDGSLPVFGSTDGGLGGAGPIVFAFDDQGRAGRPAQRRWSPKDAILLAPIAGYCLWWDGLTDWPNPRRLSQTAIAWSYFHGMAHKHADEMSLGVWAAGTSWWANVGYWSYDAAGREEAESWEGANAPHLVDERTDSPRETNLRYHGRNNHLAVIDLERRGPGLYIVRRQIVYIGPRLWIIIDTSSGVQGARTRTTWTTSPSVRLTESGASGAYKLTDGSTGKSLHAFFDGAPGTALRTIEGSHSPFGGWSVVGGMARPAPAVVVERPVDGSWALAAWSLADKPGFELGLTGAPRMQRWTGADDWELNLPTGAGRVTLKRRQGQVDMSVPSGRIWSLQLEPGADVSQAKTNLATALASASKKYGTANMSVTYRAKVTVVLLVALLLNAVIEPSRRPRASPCVLPRTGSLLCQPRGG